MQLCEYANKEDDPKRCFVLPSRSFFSPVPLKNYDHFLQLPFAAHSAQEQQQQQEPSPNFYQSESPYVSGRCSIGVCKVLGVCLVS